MHQNGTIVPAKRRRITYPPIKDQSISCWLIEQTRRQKRQKRLGARVIHKCTLMFQDEG